MKFKMKPVVLSLLAWMCLAHSSVFATVPNQNPLLPPVEIPVDANTDLKNCIEGADRNAIDENGKSTFEDGIKDLKDCTSGSLSTLRLFQGTSELTGFYDDTGKRVKATTPTECQNIPNCVFQISATVTPFCRLDSTNQKRFPTCGIAEYFQIDYQVSQVNPLPGMGTFATVKTVMSTDRPPVTIPYSALRAAKYNKVDCTELHPGDISKAFSIGVDSLGQPICGPDPNQGTINQMQQDVNTLLCQQELLKFDLGTLDQTTRCAPNIKRIKKNITKSFSSAGGSKGWEDTNAVTTSGSWSYTFSSECVPQSGQTFIKGSYVSSSASVGGSWDKVRCRRENSCTTGGWDGGACDEGDHEGSGSISSSVAVSASPTSTGVTLSVSYSLSSYDTGRADKCKGHDNDFSGHDWCCTWIGSLSISGSATIECQFKENK